MDIQEEKQKEGQRQGQKCHQHEGRQRRSQNRGKDFELLLPKMMIPLFIQEDVLDTVNQMFLMLLDFQIL